MKARKVKGLDPDASFGDNAERIVRVRTDELWSFMPRAADPAEVQALHDMRIAAKRLRYLLEVTAPCFGPGAGRAARTCKDLQDLLGDIHDCDVFLPRVRGHLARVREADVAELQRLGGRSADLDPALLARTGGDAYRGLLSLETWLEARRNHLFRRFLERWDRLERGAFREHLLATAASRPGGEPPAEPAPGPG